MRQQRAAFGHHLVPAEDAQGRTIRLHGVNQDIHDRKMAEEKVLRNAIRAETLSVRLPTIARQLDLDPLLKISIQGRPRPAKRTRPSFAGQPVSPTVRFAPTMVCRRIST